MDEDRNLKAIREGDEKAFKELVNKYKAKIVNTCYAFVHNREDAEDLAQEVFISFYQSIGKFRGECSVSTWLHRIAVNLCIDYRKSLRGRIKKINVEEWNLKTEPSSEDPLAWEHLAEDETKTLLHQAVDSLPKRQRTALILSKYENLSYQQIADVMGISVSSVESLLFRAKNNLEKIFKRLK
ncbi:MULTISPECIES: RNA polymerase sigma factor [Culturomica]|jgi:RNA polymerase sigma-70 factor (ECF subfamily)|uniref:RNA polymerase sigma factor n=1 Tax=Culturomica TaxID=1926651 RepID=UPI000336DA28|nr:MULTISPECIES: RNA polymerase sigma factor [Odoribacteraceae]RHV98038.1 RNA polymerase sigma factor [Odoribacter sp. OF09-27XD]CCZ10680.1 sigma-70 family RNA polymerase sigma factor [Odoribacter sp. CAG:788]HBO28086.1 RNA polymerase sigma factor [Culturomica sp.]